MGGPSLVEVFYEDVWITCNSLLVLMEYEVANVPWSVNDRLLGGVFFWNAWIGFKRVGFHHGFVQQEFRKFRFASHEPVHLFDFVIQLLPFRLDRGRTDFSALGKSNLN
ncbi:hypothetical protein PPYR_07738 [Photinus pyralis]|uniref:Uncharacterized protein n=1 Tax=Photinus pyralis TaxID=7054 RepID=A0A5N4ARL8_PHOPY|nr:hypothetical protein PPYR_07738 [Photinus pyralis]